MSRRIWLIYDKSNLELPKATSGVQWMAEEARLAGFQPELLDHKNFTLMTQSEGLKLLYLGQPIDLPEVALIRVYDLPLARHLEKMGVKVINGSQGTAVAQDKWQTHQLLAEQGLPMPATIYGAVLNFDAAVSELGLPFVVKQLYGNKGTDVHLVQSLEDFHTLCQRYAPGTLLCQAYIKASYGKDVRVFMVGGEAVFAVLRQSKEGFKSNFALGGTASLYPLEDTLIQLAKRCVEVTGLDIAGVDILIDEGNYVVCEVNANPAFRTIGTCSDANVPAAIFRYLKSTL